MAMFKKLKLSTKLYGGFAVVIILAGILGFVCWRSTSQLRAQMTTYARWGNIDMVMNESVSRKILLLENAFGLFRADPGPATAAPLQSALEAATQGIQEWADLVQGDSELAKVTDGRLRTPSSYADKTNRNAGSRQRIVSQEYSR